MSIEFVALDRKVIARDVHKAPALLINGTLQLKGESWQSEGGIDLGHGHSTSTVTFGLNFGIKTNRLRLSVL